MTLKKLMKSTLGSVDQLVPTTLPRTAHGKEYDAWLRALHQVDDEGQDGRGLQGPYLDRGDKTLVLDDTFYVECAGFRTWADKEERRDKLHILWAFRNNQWVELDRSSTRGWAPQFINTLLKESTCDTN